MQVRSGIDMVEVKRIERIIERGKLQAFLQRLGLQTTIIKPEVMWIITELDKAHARTIKKRLAEQLAGIFAAIEAVSKLLGSGLSRMGRSRYAGQGIQLKEIAVYYEPSGEPKVGLSGYARERALELGIDPNSISLSISHEAGLAIAVAFAISCKEKPPQKVN